MSLLHLICWPPASHLLQTTVLRSEISQQQQFHAADTGWVFQGCVSVGFEAPKDSRVSRGMQPMPLVHSPCWCCSRNSRDTFRSSLQGLFSDRVAILGFKSQVTSRPLVLSLELGNIPALHKDVLFHTKQAHHHKHYHKKHHSQHP